MNLSDEEKKLAKQYEELFKRLEIRDLNGARRISNLINLNYEPKIRGRLWRRLKLK